MRTNRFKRVGAVAAAASLALALAACGGDDEGSADGLDKVTWILPTGTAAVSNSYYLETPQTLGYYEDEGIDLTVEYASSTTDAVQLVLQDRANFTTVGTTTMLSMAASNPDVRAIGLTPSNGFFTVVEEGSDIDSMDDLEGKTIGVSAIGAAQQLFTQAALSAEGVDIDSVKWLNVGSAAQAAEAMKKGDVDAYSSYNGQLQIVGSFTDGGVRKLPSALDELGGFSGMMTSASVLEDDRDLMVRMMRALYKGFAFAEANPEAAVSMYYDAHPDQKPDVDSDQELYDATLPIVLDGWLAGGVPGDDDTYGYVADERLTQSIDFLYEHGLVEGERPDQDEIVDLSVAQDASDFDREAVQEDAKNWSKD